MKNLGKNIGGYESYIRFIIATFLVYFAIENHDYLLISISIFLYYTAFTRFCIFYYLLHINSKKRISSVALYNLANKTETSLFIFDKENKLVFRNNISKKKFLEVDSLFYFFSDFTNINDLLNTNINNKTLFVLDNISYQVTLKVSDDNDLIFLYVDDITEMLELKESIIDTQKSIIYAIGEITEKRSRETGFHVRRVSEYSFLLAKLYGLDSELSENIRIASSLHDIGKIGIPDSVLNKPGKLTEEEFEIMKTHSFIGYSILKESKIPVLRLAATIAYEHHEKYDGTGYPNNLKGTNINIAARITTIADVFDALGSKRTYKEAWPLEKILDFFKGQKFKHFDPNLVDLFLNNLDKFIEIRDKYIDEDWFYISPFLLLFF